MSTPPLRYQPYEATVDRPNVVVDGSPNAGTVLCLTHWPGIPVPPGTEADLSAQMAFRYLDLGADRHGDAEAVTNNHLDQDGLVSVHALTNPDHALANRPFLEDVASAGDFARFRFRDAARVSMVIAAFADMGRSPLAPLGDDSDAVLYEHLLRILPELVADVAAWRELWAEEDEQLAGSLAALGSGEVVVREDPSVDLAVVDFRDPHQHWWGHRFGHHRFEGIHPMAINNATERFTLLLVRGRHYQVTQRYETWVQYRSRRPNPRVDLRPLADELTAAEPGAARWEATAPDGLAPQLTLADGDESGLDRADVVARLTRHLAEAPAAWDPYDNAVG
jgi:hypothetical protein